MCCRQNNLLLKPTGMLNYFSCITTKEKHFIGKGLLSSAETATTQSLDAYLHKTFVFLRLIAFCEVLLIIGRKDFFYRLKVSIKEDSLYAYHWQWNLQTKGLKNKTNTRKLYWKSISELSNITKLNKCNSARWSIQFNISCLWLQLK